MSYRRLVGVLSLTALAVLPWRGLEAQFPPVNGPGAFNNLPGAFGGPAGGGMGAPGLAASGEAGEVVMSTDKWLVFQNEKRQQFPINYGAIKLFLIRWPATLLDASNRDDDNYLVGAWGTNLGSNQISSNHIEIYEGTATRLASPTFIPNMSFNQILPLYVAPGFNSYGTLYPNFGVFPSMLLQEQLPTQYEAVGKLASVTPPQIAVGNNLLITVQPAASMTVTQLTDGSPGMVEKGDYIFLLPRSSNYKTLQLDQLMVYKKKRFRDFLLERQREFGQGPRNAAQGQRNPGQGQRNAAQGRR